MEDSDVNSRVPPHDIAAEQGVLGGMLLSDMAISEALDVLNTRDFYKPTHATIYDTILELYGSGKPVDPVLVSSTLMEKEVLQKIGGASYLHTLVSMAPLAASTTYYARIVASKAKLRRLVEAGTRVVQLGYSGSGNGHDADDVVDAAQQVLYDIDDHRTMNTYVSLSDLVQPTLDEIETIGARDGVISGIPSGFTELDSLTSGFHPGQLIIVAARPGIGKSTLALDVIRHAAIRHGQVSAMFSLEMSRMEITMRLISAEAKIPLHSIRTGKLSDQEWTVLARRLGEVSEAPVFIDDSPNATLMEIRSKARRIKQRHDLKLLVVDYLQLMSSTRRVDNRQQEVADLSRGLKLLAKELQVPVIAVSQLNRGPEMRADKRPLLSDLRESGGIENDADMVILLHRHDYYDKNSPRAGEADFIVAKHRNGPTDVITTIFQGHYSRFVNLKG